MRACVCVGMCEERGREGERERERESTKMNAFPWSNKINKEPIYLKSERKDGFFSVC